MTPDALPAATQRKTIYLLRHGVARHNVPDAVTGARPNLLDPALTDPPLVRHGEVQARVLGEYLRRQGYAIAKADAGDGMEVDHDHAGRRARGNAAPSPIQLVVCSPLTRCLQTAAHAFPSYFASAAPLRSTMTVGEGDGAERVPLLSRECTACCHGDAREAYGMHYPDKRGPLSRLQAQFPTVAYHPALAEHDVDWQPHARETRHDVVRRVERLLTWLLRQPHEGVAVVTHGVWMELALSHFCPDFALGERRVHNCDVYRGTLSCEGDGSTAHHNSVRLDDVEQLYPDPAAV